jgi:hypothetical protein
MAAAKRAVTVSKAEYSAPRSVRIGAVAEE